MPRLEPDARARPSFLRDAFPLSRADAGRIFLVALVVRVAYLALVYRGPASLFTDDSRVYQSLATEIASGCHSLGCAMDISVTRAPLYPMFLAGVQALFGPAPIWAVAIQVGVDSASCVLVAWLAGLVDRRLAFLAGLVACIDLNLITNAGLILTESLFMAPFIASMIAALLYIERPSAPRALAAGAFVGLALLVRSVLMFFLPILLIALALAAWRRRIGPARAVRDLVLVTAATLVFVAPIVIHNARSYGRLAFVNQGGEHALLWVAPAAYEFVRGVPFADGQKEMRARLDAALAELHLEALPRNPFAASAIQERVASRALFELGLAGIARAWLDGAAINLLAPALVSVPTVSHLPRPHFYATAGRNMLDKVANFARAAGGSLFFWLMVPAVLLTLACRAIELWALLRTGRPGGLPLAPTLYLAAIAGYIVMITGPVAGVGYRIELEPFLAILLASGLLRLWRRGDGSTSRA